MQPPSRLPASCSLPSWQEAMRSWAALAQLAPAAQSLVLLHKSLHQSQKQGHVLVTAPLQSWELPPPCLHLPLLRTPAQVCTILHCLVVWWTCSTSVNA
jgi:hypothetical protein